MEYPLFNQVGEKIGKIDLPKEIFDLEFNSDLVHQVAVCQMANKRKPIAHTKTRAEVSGGGRKPWPQKGLGRARHGSIRSPLWKGGGVVFGPRKDKVFSKKIPKKMKRKALFCLLSEKLRQNLILIFETLKIEKPKTKLFSELLKTWKKKIENFDGKSVLIAIPQKDKNIILATRNVPKVKTVLVENLNVLDLLTYKYLILTKDGIEKLKERFLR